MNDPPEDPDRVFLEIGARDDCPPVQIRKAALAFVLSIRRWPKAIHHLSIAGYDADVREVWEIPEASLAFRRFADCVMILLPGTTFLDWHLGEETIGVLAMCTGQGRATDTGTGYRIEIP